MVDWLNSWVTSNNFFRDVTIGSLSVVLISSLYFNYKYSQRFNLYQEKIITLKSEVNTLNFNNRNLNTELSIAKNKIFDLEKKNIKFENIENWNYLFTHDIFNIYKSSQEFAELIHFDHQQFITLTAFKLMNLELLEYRTKIAINRIIYNPNLLLNLNSFNFLLIDYEINLFFNKIKYLYCDYEINKQLFLKYHNTTPFYNIHYTPLKNLVNSEKLPYSFSPTYANKYHFDNLYYGLKYTNRNIRPFE